MEADLIAQVKFNKDEFNRSSPEEKILMLKALAAEICKQADARPFEWKEFLRTFEAQGPTRAFLMCHHGLVAMATALNLEERLTRLEQSMEILCEEMEQVRAQSDRKFIMGPGVKDDA